MKTLVKELSVMPQPALALKQVVLWIGANAGGVGKTTLAIHIGYEMACRGFDVALIDLDTNVSMSLFCGLPLNPSPQQSIASVFSEDFAGEWPLLTPEWGKPKGRLQVGLGGMQLSRLGTELASRLRREYLLSDLMQDYPLPHQLVILDCPATIGSLCEVALVAATHLLIPLRLSDKSFSGASQLLSWYRSTCRGLRLNPAPQLLGFVPTIYDDKHAPENHFLNQFPDLANSLKVRGYAPIRKYYDFENSLNQGKPLTIYRPGHKGTKAFNPICDDLVDLLRGGANAKG